jgi:hypothetical protein
MSKYKKILALIVSYNIFIICMLLFIPAYRDNAIYIYSSIYFILFIFFSYFILVNRELNILEVSKYSTKKSYILCNYFIFQYQIYYLYYQYLYLI